MPQTPQPAAPEKIIDTRYRIVRMLGEGGFGQVFECEHVGMPRRYAVKLLLPEIARRKGVLERFLREAQAAGGIQSRHVIQIIDVGQCRTSGAAFIAMELLDGEDLAKTLERGAIPPDAALRVAVQALDGLRAAHARGVVHRDLKPPNLFLAREPGGERTVKLLDFGIAKLLGSDDVQRGGLTATGSILGSPWYMSPEQALGRKDIDHRTDIRSLGALLYESLAGVPPYHGASNLHVLLRAICDGPPRPLAEVAPHVPLALCALVARAMAHDPADRFQTAEEMLAAVQLLRPGGASLTDRMLGIPDAPAQAPASEGVTQPMRPAALGSTHAGLARSAGRSARRAYFLGTAAVVAVLGIAALVLKQIPRPAGSASDTSTPGNALASVSASASPSDVTAPSGSTTSLTTTDAGPPPEDAGADTGTAPHLAPAKRSPKAPAGGSRPPSGDPFTPTKNGR